MTYLVDKGFVRRSGKGKYKYRYEKDAVGVVRLLDAKDTPILEGDFAIADVWLSDERIRSTIGAPTVENVGEVLDFAIQTEIISASKGNWTSSGTLAAELRRVGGETENPFLIGPEIAVYVRTLFRLDGWTLKAIISRFADMPDPFNREDMIEKFGEIVVEVGGIVTKVVKNKSTVKEYAALTELVGRNIKKRAGKTEEETVNLGVLEHRVSPRLEWLTDLRALAKTRRNAFEYTMGEQAACFRAAMEKLGETEESRDEAALAFLVASDWSSRELANFCEADPFTAILKAYALVRPSIGPARIEDVAYMAGILIRNPSKNVAALSEYIVEIAKEREEVSVSGDRFTRSPKLVHIKEKLWKQ
ncbi:hypothetical protein [Prosthecomicrobium sp. N25]|uniref:hypothetical protein n=1 Tax=Prosthecomicrobium sp. N25 TaxID=3129254 RepID=UPI0030783E7E